MLPSVYRDLPANYEEPWDTEEKKMHFNRMLNRAEKKHERRQSVEKSSDVVSKNSELIKSTKCAINSGGGGGAPIVSPPSVPKTVRIVPDGSYEAAWQSSTPNQRKQSDSSNNSASINSSRKPIVHGILPSNYEDAWDLPLKQREFEEKLEKARKGRASKGQIREEGDDEVFANLAEQAKQRTDIRSSSRASNRSMASPVSPTSKSGLQFMLKGILKLCTCTHIFTFINCEMKNT